MDWLTQNWVWIVFAIGAVWLFRRGGLAGCAMGGHGSHGGHSGKTADPMRTPPGISEKAVDPVSGREVLASQAVNTLYNGRAYYFESPENRQRFEAAPEQYARGAAPVAHQHRHHGC